MASTRTGSGSKSGNVDSVQLKALLELGKRAVAAMRDGSLESLDILEEYVRNFDSWEASWREGRAKSKEIPPKQREMATRIAHQHTQIIRLANELRSEMDESLKSLRVKGRGLKAYMDHLPQRVSTIKTRKG